MAIGRVKTLGMILIIVGIIGIAFGGGFIFQGISKSNLITEAMCLERVTYGGADGDIDGIIDTPTEAQVMASILKGHRMENYGFYSELERDDPGRETILSAMTMENSLNLAQVGYGLAGVVKYTGIFMGLIGITFVVGGAIVFSTGRPN